MELDFDPRVGLRGGLRPTPIFNKPKPLPPKQGLKPTPPTPGMDRRDYFEKLQAQGFEIPTGMIKDPPRGGFPNMPNLQGIGGIPGLQNIDFSNLPMGMNFGNFNPRAINANPQGFQDMIERARAQEGLQGTLGGPMEYSDARRRAIKTGTPMPNMEDYDMSPLGPRIGNDQTLPMPPPEAFQGRIEQANQQEDFPISGGPAQGPAPDYSTLPEGIDPGGQFFTGPNGERMYSPPMPKFGPGIVGSMMMPPAIDLDTGQPGAYIREDIPRLAQDLGGFEGGFEGSLPGPRPSIPGMGSPGGTPGFYDKVMPTGPALDQPNTLGGLNPVPMPSQPAQTTAPVQPTAPVQQPLAPYTGSNEPAPYASNVVRTETGMDALTKQLLFGLDGKGGFIPGAMQAAEKTFFNADGTPRVVEEQVAGLSPDQIRAQELAREGIGIQDPYLQQAGEAYATGVGALDKGLDKARQRELESLGVIQSGVGSLGRELSDVENIQRGAVGNFGTQLGSLAGRSVGATDEFGNKLSGLEGRSIGDTDQFGNKLSDLAGRSIGATDQFGNRLGESENLLRGTTGAYNPSLTSQFYNPYEDQVVQQTIDDVFEAGEKQDMAARARDIQTGGESAFGSRARLGAAERRESLGRGLGEALGALRSRGFSEAQQTGMGEFARQRDAERAAASGLSGLAGSRLGSQQNLTNQLSGFAGQQLGSQQDLTNQLSGFAGSKLGAQQNLTNQLSGFAGQQLGAQQGLASNLGALAGTRFGAQQTQAGALSNLGNLEAQIGQQQQQAQFGLGSNLQGLGQQAQTANQAGVGQLYNIGQQQQNLQQQQLDAQRRNQLQAQQAPLAQYQALSPFIQMAPQGLFQSQSTFAPRPSAMQAGLGVGLSTLGAVGNFMNQGTRK